MRNAVLYALAAGFLVLIIAVAWWTRGFEPAGNVTDYTVRTDETVPEIASAHEVTVEELAELNDVSPDEFEPRPGQVIQVPAAQSVTNVWTVHVVGLVAEVVGVLMSFWLALVAGLLPAGLRRQILGIALVLGVASYAASQGIAADAPVLTPQFVFGAVKDGFAWSAAFPLFARAFGFTKETVAAP